MRHNQALGRRAARALVESGRILGLEHSAARSLLRAPGGAAELRRLLDAFYALDRVRRDAILLRLEAVARPVLCRLGCIIGLAGLA